MNQEHEKLKMNVRVFVDVMKSFTFNSQSQGVVNALMDTDAFKEMDRLTHETERLNDDGEEEEYDPSDSGRPEWEANPER